MENITFFAGQIYRLPPDRSLSIYFRWRYCKFIELIRLHGNFPALSLFTVHDETIDYHVESHLLHTDTPARIQRY